MNAFEFCLAPVGALKLLSRQFRHQFRPTQVLSSQKTVRFNMIWSKDCSLHEKCQKSVGAVEAIKQHSARDVIGPFGHILALWMIFNNS